MRNGSLLASLGLALGLSVFSLRPLGAAVVETMRVNLPRAAEVGSVTLPPGEYSIRTVSTNGNSTMFEFQGPNGSAVIAAAGRISTALNLPSDQTKVVLRRDGDHYVVDQLWLVGQPEGYEFLSARH